jgi:predicted nucleic acid-binding Zn ribbon protein
MDKKVAPERICVVCMKDIPTEARFCPNCGHNYTELGDLEMGKKVGTVLPVLGGLLILVVGLVQIANGLVAIANLALYIGPDTSSVLGLSALDGVIILVTGLIAAIGGWSAIARKNLVLSLTGGIISLGVVGLVYGYGTNAFYATQLALVGIILIAIAHDEFKR